MKGTGRNMAGRDYLNMIIIGSSGSGKSHWLDKELLPAFENRFRYKVVINTTSELREHCKHYEYVNEEQQIKEYDIDQLAELIKYHGSVFFEVPAGEYCSKFLESLGKALWTLGKYETKYTEVLIITEEAHNYFSKREMPKSFARIEAEGRKHGFSIIKVTQTLQSQTGETISHLAIKQSNVLAVFNMSDFNDRKRIKSLFPQLPDPADLARPDDGGAPEYAVRDSKRGRSIVVKREGRERVYMNV